MNNIKLSGMTLATTAATLLLSACGADKTTGVELATSASANVKCSGINSCKGTSACATATTTCHSQNQCKGQGWIKVTKEVCESKGGKVLS